MDPNVQHRSLRTMPFKRLVTVTIRFSARGAYHSHQQEPSLHNVAVLILLCKRRPRGSYAIVALISKNKFWAALIREGMFIKTIARVLNRTDSCNRFLCESDFPFVLNKIRPQKILHVYYSVKVGEAQGFRPVCFCPLYLHSKRTQKCVNHRYKYLFGHNFISKTFFKLQLSP